MPEYSVQVRRSTQTIRLRTKVRAPLIRLNPYLQKIGDILGDVP